MIHALFTYFVFYNLQVLSKRARQWCQRPGDNNAIPYLETSAREATKYVEQAFKIIAEIAISLLQKSSILNLSFDDGLELELPG